MALKFTGERFVPDSPSSYSSIAYEHWHRYAYAQRFAAGKRVLDAACGEGYGAAFLARVAQSVVGVDIAEEALEHARTAHARDNLRFLQGSVAKLPIGDEKFDLVTSFETIEHVEEPAQLSFIREVRRVLEPDGVFIISSPDRRTYSDERGYRNQYHLRELYFDEFRDMLAPHFKHLQFLAQGVHGISYLHPLDTREGHLVEIGVRGLERGTFEPDESSPPHLYFIAICSSKPIELPHSLLWERTEGLLDESAVPLRAEIMRFGLENERLGKELAEARALLAESERELTSRVEEIAMREAQLAQREAQLAERDAQISDLDRKISAMSSTTTWRAKRAIEDVSAKIRTKLRG